LVVLKLGFLERVTIVVITAGHLETFPRWPVRAAGRPARYRSPSRIFSYWNFERYRRATPNPRWALARPAAIAAAAQWALTTPAS
jgi:hypothetical protein